jgi:multidrug efflux system outer membrane protein
LAALAALSACQSSTANYTAASRPVLLERFPSALAEPPPVPPGLWWTDNAEPELAQLIEEGLAANLDLEEAAARVRASRALLRETRTQGRPSLDLDASISANRQSSAAFGFPGATSQDQVSPSASVLAGWEIDLFGRVARLVESARADASASEASRDDLARLIAADIALAYLDLREAETRIAVGERNLVNQRSTLDLTGILLENGKASRLDLARSEAQVATTEARLPQLRAQSVAARNRLTTLLALEPGALDARLAASSGLPDLSDVVFAGAPSLVISRRPDVRAAERALAASAAGIGVATAELYPTISLTGSAGLSSAETADFTSGDAFSFGFGPRLTWNLFDRGAVYARIEQADANAAGALARFRQTALLALEEVDTALSAYNEEGERASRLTKARDASAEAQELARARFEMGREPFLTVLDAERVLLAADDEVTVSAAARIRAQIQLYRALAGGWGEDTDPSQPSPPEPVQ